MNLPAHLGLARRLLQRLDGAKPFGARIGEIPAAHYLSSERFERERQAVFSLPQVVAHESELAEPGSCLTVDVAGVPLLILRAEDGSIGAFRNACRHRSTRLVTADAPCQKKALVCPYHGWTYDLGGRLVHAPHEESFGAALGSRLGLVGAHAASHLGLIWAALQPFDIAAYVAPIAADLEALAGERWVVYRRSTREVRGNWKLIVDAFLDGYHIRHLHRDSVYRFFVDSLAEAEPAGPHIRALTARRTLRDADARMLEAADLRQLATPSYLIFPSTTLVLHPDFLSILYAQPVSAGRTRFGHTMLIAKPPRTDAEADHWAKSFALIDEGVFAREDLAAVEAMQRGIEAGANQSLLFGELEHAALWFHESLESAINPAT